MTAGSRTISNCSFPFTCYISPSAKKQCRITYHPLDPQDLSTIGIAGKLRLAVHRVLRWTHLPWTLPKWRSGKRVTSGHGPSTLRSAKSWIHTWHVHWTIVVGHIQCWRNWIRQSRSLQIPDLPFLLFIDSVLLRIRYFEVSGSLALH